MDINQLNVAILLDRLDTYGSENFKIDKDEEFNDEWKVLTESREEYYKKASKVLLKRPIKTPLNVFVFYQFSILRIVFRQLSYNQQIKDCNFFL